MNGMYDDGSGSGQNAANAAAMDDQWFFMWLKQWIIISHSYHAKKNMNRRHNHSHMSGVSLFYQHCLIKPKCDITMIHSHTHTMHGMYDENNGSGSAVECQ